MIEYNEDISERLCLPALDATTPSAYKDTNNNSDTDKGKPNRADKYSLRPRSLRRRNVSSDEIEDIQPKSHKNSRKPALLSKYRRKTANARERTRMREINQAYETLRQVLPHIAADRTENEKVTKITTLRLAMKYISTLSAVLSTEGIHHDFFSDCSEPDCFLLESDGESLNLPSDLSEHSITPANFSVDFPDNSLDFTPLSPDLADQLYQFDPFLSDFS